MLNRRNILYSNPTHLSVKFSIKIQRISVPSMQFFFFFVKFLLAYWEWKFDPVPLPQGGIPPSERWHSEGSSQMGPKKTLLLPPRAPLDDSQRVRPRPRISRPSNSSSRGEKGARMWHPSHYGALRKRSAKCSSSCFPWATSL